MYLLNLRLGFNTGVAFLGCWLWRTRSGAEALGLGLVIGGALGNILDRLRQGAVTDFDAHCGGWHWPTVNVADVGIVCGVGLLLISALQPTAPKVAGHATPAGREARFL
ncbi:signal peptidase II [Roseicella aerolata]|uniref:signal peptidase II n=1 Tax=Roseicella aerolata TaxID=2883479 RepID=UPI003084279E